VAPISVGRICGTRSTKRARTPSIAPRVSTNSSGRNTTTWQQFDISEGGISLSLGDTPQEKIRVGEIIGYRSEPGEPWAIGSVRWMQFLKGRGLSIGVRKMTTRSFAIGGRAVEGTGEGGEYFRMLLTDPLDDPANACSTSAPRCWWLKVRRSATST
jgi:hypothetical protein